MKRTWYVGCYLENGEECRTPFVPVTAGSTNTGDSTPAWESDAPDLTLPLERVQSRRMYEALISTETAIDTKYPEEMQAKLPLHLRGLAI